MSSNDNEKDSEKQHPTAPADADDSTAAEQDTSSEDQNEAVDADDSTDAEYIEDAKSSAEDSTAEDTTDNTTESTSSTAAEQDTGSTGDAQTGVDAIKTQLQRIPSEDWLLIALVALVVVPFGYVFASSQGLVGGDPLDNVDADSEVVQYCMDVADAIEADADFGDGTTCDCIPPGHFDEERYQTADERVQAVTELFLVQCTFPTGQEMTFPIGYIPSDQEANMTEDMMNETFDEDMPIIE